MPGVTSHQWIGAGDQLGTLPGSRATAQALDATFLVEFNELIQPGAGVIELAAQGDVFWQKIGFGDGVWRVDVQQKAADFQIFSAWPVPRDASNDGSFWLSFLVLWLREDLRLLSRNSIWKWKIHHV